ncbi:hypothetical protein ACFL7M_15995 [Thermodesulfobacteriota bacterium]
MDRKVPTAVPSEEPAYSRAYAMDAGKKNAPPALQIIPTKINRGRVLEKDSTIIAAIAVKRKVRIRFLASPF